MLVIVSNFNLFYSFFPPRIKDGSAFGSTFFLPSTWKGYWLIKPFEMSKEVNSEIIDEKKSDSLK